MTENDVLAVAAAAASSAWAAVRLARILASYRTAKRRDELKARTTS